MPVIARSSLLFTYISMCSVQIFCELLSLFTTYHVRGCTVWIMAEIGYGVEVARTRRVMMIDDS